MPYCNHHKNKNKNTIKIPDKLWDKINILLPTEKPNNTGVVLLQFHLEKYSMVLFMFLEPKDATVVEDATF